MRDLGSERYVSITSFRRDGTGVATPVWVDGVYLELTLAALAD